MKSVRLILYVALVAGLFRVGLRVTPVAAQSGRPEQTMQTAAQLYAQGEYALAAQSYQQLVDQGYADSALYYNLGQAYWQAGDLGHALWGLRSAQALDPRDGEIEAALAAVRQEVAAQGQLVQVEADPLTQAEELSNSWFSLDDLAIVALVLWIAFTLLLMIFVLRLHGRGIRRFARIATPIVGALFIVAVIALGSRMRLYNDAAEAIVVARQVDITNGPGPQFGVQFGLSAGAEVNIVETRGDYIRIIETGNGASGWAPAEAVATVQPTSKG